MLTIKKNDKPKLKKCEMLCDGGIDEKLNKYELTKHLNNHSTILMLGKPRSGKTSLLYSFFKSKEIFGKTFDKVFIIQPEQSRASMKDPLFDKLPDDQRFNELNIENLNAVEGSLSEHNNILILDDVGAYLKDADNCKKLKELVYNRRHKHLTILFLCQSWISVPKDIRKLFSNIFLFKCSKKEMETLWDEVIELNKDYMLPMMRKVYDEPYKFMFIDTDTQQFFDGWDEIIIS
jgi:GTPase SAR1 family protein